MITIAISIGHMVIHPWICVSPNLQRHILSMSCRVGHRTVQDANFEFLTRTCIGTLMTQAMDPWIHGVGNHGLWDEWNM